MATHVVVAVPADRATARSSARRLLDGAGTVDRIDLDFAGVDQVGQGFVDEALRVWPRNHPGVVVACVNMNADVAFMVARGTPRT